MAGGLKQDYASGAPFFHLYVMIKTSDSYTMQQLQEVILIQAINIMRSQVQDDNI